MSEESGENQAVLDNGDDVMLPVTLVTASMHNKTQAVQDTCVILGYYLISYMSCVLARAF